MTKARGTDLQGQNPWGAPVLGWGCGSAVIQEFPPGLTVLPQEGDTSVSAGSAVLAHPGEQAQGQKWPQRALKAVAVRNSPPSNRGAERVTGPECPLGAPHPAGMEWRPVGGHWARQRLFLKSMLRLAMGFWQDPCLGSLCCFLHRNPCLHPTFYGLPALQEGIQPPQAVSQLWKGLTPQ